MTDIHAYMYFGLKNVSALMVLLYGVLWGGGAVTDHSLFSSVADVLKALYYRQVTGFTNKNYMVNIMCSPCIYIV